MPHFRKILYTGYYAAEDFMDDNMKPCEHTLTIKAVTAEAPPTGGSKLKPCFTFMTTDKKMLVANGEIKKLARMLRLANTDDWPGTKIVVSCAQKKFAGQDVWGMVIVSAEKPKGQANATK